MSERKQKNQTNAKDGKGPAKRRNNKQRNRRANNKKLRELAPQQKDMLRKKAIAENNKITPAPALVMAQGVKNTITVKVDFDITSLQCAPIGRISMGLVRGAESPYSVYKVIYEDFTSLIKGNNGTAPSRFKYENEIYAAVVPKIIPFRLDCALQVSVNEFDSTPSNAIGIHNGKTYYMWETTTTGPWALQTAPGPSTADADKAAYNDYQSKLGGKVPHMQIIRDIQLADYYKKDGSGFARVSPYYGQGAGVGGAFSSVEFETPFRSKLLGTFCEFSDTTPRASRKLAVSSGDACSNWSIGAIDEFKTSFYTGANPPIYKFLDIAEVACILANSMVLAMASFLQSGNTVGQANNFLDLGLSYNYQTFLLMLRQQILYMFADSQCLAQCLSFETGNNAFQAFLCGSNTYPREPPTRMLIPAFLNENFKMLKMAIRPYLTRNYSNNRNHIIHIPVWGAYIDYAAPGFVYYNSQGDPVDLFNNEAGALAGPDIWDGTDGNDVVDLNASDAIAAAIIEWNDWMTALNNVFAGVDAIGGDSNGAPLLQFTRYVQYNAIEKDGKKDKEMILDAKKRVPRIYEPFVRSRKLERTKSAKGTDTGKEIIQRYIAIPDSTVFTEWTRGYSGMIPITPSHKEFFPAFVLPIIDLTSNDGLPSISQVQVANQEGFSLFKSTELGDTFFGTRASEIIALLPNLVIGVAGKKTPLADFIDELSKNNQGAFLGDLFSTVGNIASGLGFGGVGSVASTLGGIGNALGI